MKRVASFFVGVAKWSFDVITWVVSHPLVAMWIVQIALRLKKAICREISLKLGFGGGEAVETDLLTLIKERSKRLYNENVEPVVLSAVHTFVSGSGFDWLVNGVASNLSWAMSAALAPLAAFAGPVAFVGSFFIGSGIADMMKETLRTTAIAATTTLILQKTGQDLAELISSECLQTQPNSYVWAGVSWFGEQKE